MTQSQDAIFCAGQHFKDSHFKMPQHGGFRPVFP